MPFISRCRPGGGSSSPAPSSAGTSAIGYRNQASANGSSHNPGDPLATARAWPASLAGPAVCPQIQALHDVDTPSGSLRAAPPAGGFQRELPGCGSRNAGLVGVSARLHRRTASTRHAASPDQGSADSGRRVLTGSWWRAPGAAARRPGGGAGCSVVIQVRHGCRAAHRSGEVPGRLGRC